MTPAQQAAQYLSENRNLYGLPADPANLQLVAAKESLLGTHYRYQQTINGIPVEHAQVVVSVSADGAIYRVFNNAYPQKGPLPLPAGLIPRSDAIQRAWNHLRVHGDLITTPRADLVYVPQGPSFRLIYRTLIAVQAPFGHWEQRVDAATGEILEVRRTEILDGRDPAQVRKARQVPDFRLYTGPVLSLQEAGNRYTSAAAIATGVAMALAPDQPNADGAAFVFDPDPKTALMNDTIMDTSVASAFDPAYATRALQSLTVAGGLYKLQGPWVTIADLEAPNTAPSTSATGAWTAKRGNNAFNDAMTYFHIDQSQRYLQSLGYTGARGVQYGSIQADSDGVNGDDNSYFSPGANTLSFGHGGVDDNEDSGVILHEYWHAIQNDINPSWGGGDAGAMGEGFGDYWGASYSYSTPNGPLFHPEWAFKWDGHTTGCWGGRYLDRLTAQYDPTVTYADHVDMGGFQSDELWGTPVFQAFLTLRGMGRPRAEIDQIMVESQFGLGASLTMRDMAKVVVQTAQTLFPTGVHAQLLLEKFLDRSILTIPAPLTVYPSDGEILTTGSTVTVRWDTQGAPARTAGVLQYGRSATGTTFQDAMENGANGWTAGQGSGASANWSQVTTASHSPTKSWFASDVASIGDQYLISPPISVPTNSVFSFWHKYDLESSYDGGVVEISINGTNGAWTDLGSRITQNGYNSTISTDWGSPIAGSSAFSGSSSSFVETLIDLSAYVNRTNVRVRFRLATDDGEAATGWWVDDVKVTSGQAWASIGTSPTGATTLAWTLPATPATDYCVRAKLTGTNWVDSAWSQTGPLVVSADSDGDGIPDAWEMKHFGSLTNANASSDRDRDGSKDLFEYLAGTSPTNPLSRFAALSVSNAPATGFRVQWESVSNRVYAVGRSTNLLSAFIRIASNLPATPPVNQYIDGSATGLPVAVHRILLQ